MRQGPRAEHIGALHKLFIATAGPMIIVGPCDNGLGALLTVSGRAICPVAKGAVEIALAGRDNFGTAVTSALILFPRPAPLRNRFVQSCLLHFCSGRPAVRSETTVTISL